MSAPRGLICAVVLGLGCRPQGKDRSGLRPTSDSGAPSWESDETGETDDCSSPSVWYDDQDQDGYGDPASEGSGCDVPDGAASNALDCDDRDAAISPEAGEVCDAQDNDCDGSVDEAGAAGGSVWYWDGDGDGVGDSAETLSACDQPGGYASESGDCDDSDAEISPHLEERCANGVDEDCDGRDQTCAITGEHLLEDADVVLVGEEGDAAAYGLRPAGDVNGDGVPDLIIGAYRSSIRASFDGAAFVVYGPQDSGAVRDLAGATLVGEEADWRAGQAVAPFQDLDGDGFDEVMVGDDRATGSASVGGIVYLNLGPLTGQIGLEDSDLRFDGAEEQTQLGNAMERVGDVDGDGEVDLLIGGDGWDSYIGAAFLFYGPLDASRDTDEADLTLQGEQHGQHLGMQVAAPGDTDGDGLMDAVVAAGLKGREGENRGSVYVLTDAWEGVYGVEDLVDPILGEADSDYAGSGVSAPGDLNEDGYADLLVGASGDDSDLEDAGALYLLLGPMSGYDTMADAITKLTGAESSEGVRQSGSGEDVNGDGAVDLIVGAEDLGPKGILPGKAYLMLGPVPEGTSSLSEADGVFRGDEPDDGAGDPVSLLPDWNGDGYAELLVGASGNDDGGSNAGAAYIIHGAPD